MPKRIKRGEAKKLLTKEFLERRYVADGLTMTDIAKEIGCSLATVSIYISQFGLKPPTWQKYIGQTFGQLTVLSYAGRDKKQHNVVLCQCTCGKTKAMRACCLTSGNSKTCGCSLHKRGQDNPCYRGYGELSQTLFHSIRIGASDRGLPFKITIKDAWNKFVKQNGLCAITGIKLSFCNYRNKTTATTASLDRIDSSKGYTRENIQWVHKKINRMKWNLPQDEFIELCRAVAVANPK